MKPLKFVLDFRSDIPVTSQIVAQVRNNLVRGEWKPGDQLPTVRQLAADLHVNFNTVARAYRILDETGLISTQQGRGTYILGDSAPEETRLNSVNDLSRQLIQVFDFLEQQGYGGEEITIHTKLILDTRYKEDQVDQPE